MDCIEFKNASFCYPNGTLANEELNLHIGQGERVAIIGQNGAGKTTLMRMICGVLKPSSGSIRLNGRTLEELGEKYYAHLGYMPQDFGFYPDFTAREFMLYIACLLYTSPSPRD